MELRVYDVVIDRDKMTKSSRQVWAWELPLLELKFPGGLVKIIRKVFIERDELRDPAAEYARLDAQYGQEADTNLSLVGIAYDRGDKGVALLAKALKASVRRKSASKSKPAKPTKDPLE